MAKMSRARVDELNRQRLSLIHPYVAEKGAAFLGMCENHLGIVVFIVSGLRTFDEQAAAYAQGRTKPGPIVTWVGPGRSFHNYGLAIDHWPLLQLTPKMFELDWEDTAPVIAAFKKTRALAASMGFGVIEKDRPHLQWPGGWTCKALREAGYGQDLPIDDIPLS